LISVLFVQTYGVVIAREDPEDEIVDAAIVEVFLELIEQECLPPATTHAPGRNPRACY
jgi:hypothetical protein